MSFSAVCPTNFTVRLRKTTTISTTFTYYREFLTERAPRSSRTIEYYVLLSLRTIEKRKDWIWIGFQPGPAFFVRTIENYVLWGVRTIEKWLYSDSPPYVLPSRREMREIVSKPAAIAFQSDLSRAEFEWFYTFGRHFNFDAWST